MGTLVKRVGASMLSGFNFRWTEHSTRHSIQQRSPLCEKNIPRVCGHFEPGWLTQQLKGSEDFPPEGPSLHLQFAHSFASVHRPTRIWRTASLNSPRWRRLRKSIRQQIQTPHLQQGITSARSLTSDRACLTLVDQGEKGSFHVFARQMRQFITEKLGFDHAHSHFRLHWEFGSCTRVFSSSQRDEHTHKKSTHSTVSIKPHPTNILFWPVRSSDNSVMFTFFMPACRDISTFHSHAKLVPSHVYDCYVTLIGNSGTVPGTNLSPITPDNSEQLRLRALRSRSYEFGVESFPGNKLNR